MIPHENDICDDCGHSLIIEHVFYCSQHECHCEYSPVESVSLLRAEVEELRKDRERLLELEAYQEQMDTIWAEYIQKRLPGFEALCDFVLDPAHKDLFDAAIEAANGGEEDKSDDHRPADS